MESDVCDRDGHPGQKCRDRCDILEPLEDGLGASGARHVGKQGERGGNGDAPVRNASSLRMLTKLTLIRGVAGCDLPLGAC